MSLTEAKKGGPYTKNDREGRRNEVARLHFEFGYSARKIAETMKINPNTINADIQYLYNSIKEETRQKRDDLILQQLGRLDAQRTRILEGITEGGENKVKLEKLLLDIDSKINDILMRISKEPNALKEKKDESQIRELILFLIIKHAKNPCIRNEELICEIINLEECTMEKSIEIVTDMESLGLKCCLKLNEERLAYDLLEFALLRKYIKHNGDFIDKIHALWMIHQHSSFETDDLNRKYLKEFRGRTTWSEKTHEKFDEEMKAIEARRAKAIAGTITDIINNEDDGVLSAETFIRYAKYMGTFFGNRKTVLEGLISDSFETNDEFL
ncbi:MAG: hypothetical protein DWQ18_03955 [Crenarchaeota archaeon]|nr:MAG: hypothetical protein DWQ17_09175 [Thermoproteota archaeon]RDJ34063.1 MAG: hypothetical protein DWQ18_03955 [Thermoproteota archaeon]RDJ36822.1 MAG: hypothetical protein DWQ13_06660 [Thermoproteota archaeon]RDJ37643.1 MAG: hypothetical protein DWQ19_04175 [Thermoproteota archaeon]